MKLSNGVYDVFKWLGLVFFPALANAVGVFIGALIGVSQATIAKEDALEEFYETESEDELPVEEDEPETEEV